MTSQQDAINTTDSLDGYTQFDSVPTPCNLPVTGGGHVQREKLSEGIVRNLRATLRVI